MGSRSLLLYAIFTASVFILALKLVTPSTIYFVITDGSVSVYEVPHIYTLSDVLIITAATAVASATATLIYLTPTTKPTQEKKTIDLTKYEETIRNLKGLEKDIVKLLIENGGAMYQSDIAKQLNIPKSTLSTVLTKLENKGLIERRRKGLKNLVVLKP